MPATLAIGQGGQGRLRAGFEPRDMVKVDFEPRDMAAVVDSMSRKPSIRTTRAGRGA
ncbi:hypothetical protein AURDEDRAFT_146145 [Auricularia subglabra TFB-10046 SS5]|nr:hypothetical protein AURDEDRAFT_146145 [Auricularia subglabra TFB-10046 SS5]